MNNQITKQEAQALIDKLANKELTFGCEVRGKWGVRIVLSSFGDGKCFHAFDPEYQEVEMEEAEGFGQRWMEVASFKTKEHEILGRPILIGDVLEKASWNPEVTYYWMAFGGKTSLQSILESAEWDDNWCPLRHYPHTESCVRKRESIQVLKPSPAHDLFSFLINLQL